MKTREEALEILEINVNITDITLEHLKKQYRKMALKHHTDKNGNKQESNDNFKNINEAYHWLKREKDLAKDEEEEDEYNRESSPSIYLLVLKNFIKTVMDGNYMEAIPTIVYDILMSNDISAKIFENLDKEVVLNIYVLLSKYKTILHLRDDVFEKIKQMVVDKYEHVEIYKLNPSVNDLINSNFYKLYVKGQLFLVPLWHYESYYDTSGCEIIVICDPELPDNIKIDDDNNLIVSITINEDITEMIIKEQPLVFYIGENEYAINLSNLYMKKEQYYCFKGQGIPKVTKNIYDVSDKMDIIIKISIHL